MPNEVAADSHEITIDLRDPLLAAFLAWLIPGAGHFYQRRWAKGVLYSVCILTTFIFGLFIGGGRVVYASWRNNDTRLPYVCQIGVGLPALPAIVQAVRTSGDTPKAPLWRFDGPEGFGLMAPPRLPGQIIPSGMIGRELTENLLGTDDYVRVRDARSGYGPALDELSQWHHDLGGQYDLGTVYTMIAGLLNILAVWDAYGGPVGGVPDEAEEADAKAKAAKISADLQPTTT